MSIVDKLWVVLAFPKRSENPDHSLGHKESRLYLPSKAEIISSSSQSFHSLSTFPSHLPSLSLSLIANWEHDRRRYLNIRSFFNSEQEVRAFHIVSCPFYFPNFDPFSFLFWSGSPNLNSSRLSNFGFIHFCCCFSPPFICVGSSNETFLYHFSPVLDWICSSSLLFERIRCHRFIWRIKKGSRPRQGSFWHGVVAFCLAIPGSSSPQSLLWALLGFSTPGIDARHCRSSGH